MRRVLSPVDIDDFRDRVCAAATELFAEFGEEGFNMRKLAARLGISAMTTYRYFKSKSEILAAVRTRAFARLADRLKAAHYTADSLAQTLATLSRVCVEFAREEQVQYELVYSVSQSRSGPTSELRREEERARDAFTKPLHLLARSGRCNGDAEVVGRMLWCSLQGIISLNLTGSLSEQGRDRMIAEAVRVLVASCDAGGQLEPAKSTPLDSPASFQSNGSGAHRIASVAAIEGIRDP